MAFGGVGDDLRQGSLACARRSPQNDGREQPVRFDGAAQEFPLADDVFLPDVFLQRARTHPRGKRRFGFHAFLHGIVEEIGHGLDYSRAYNSERVQGTGYIIMDFDVRFETAQFERLPYLG